MRDKLKRVFLSLARIGRLRLQASLYSLISFSCAFVQISHQSRLLVSYAGERLLSQTCSHPRTTFASTMLRPGLFHCTLKEADYTRN